MRNFTALALLAVLSFHSASATWSILRTHFGDHECDASSNQVSFSAFSEGDCYSWTDDGTDLAAMVEDRHVYYYRDTDCDGTPILEGSIDDDACVGDADLEFSLELIEDGLSQPVTSEYPLASASFSNDDCSVGQIGRRCITIL